MNLILIDGDPIAHAACHCNKDYDEEGFTRNEEDVEAAIEAAFFHTLYNLENTYGISISHYMFFLSGKNNFRKIINPEYKANRRDKKAPPMLGYAHEYLVKNHNAFVSHGVEADDSIIATWRNFGESPFFNPKEDICVIASLDKDFQQVPCLFYNYHYKHNDLHYINQFDANKFFYKQMLMGDSVDNIKGIPRCGEKTAEKILKDCKDEFSMKVAVYAQYKKKFGRKAREQYVLNWRMLRMVDRGIEIPMIFNEVVNN